MISTELRHVLTILRLLLVVAILSSLGIASQAQTDEAYNTALQRILTAQANQATSLELNHLNLTTLPPEIGQLSHLEMLRLEYNKLTELPASIGGLVNLQTLDLAGNDLTALPQEYGQLTNLQTLRLGYNKLTELPASIGGLVNLQTLDLASNDLTALPQEFGQLRNLRVVDLRYNDLVSLPPEFAQLSSLTSLDLSDNQFTSFPLVLAELPILEHLSLSGNQLRSIPPEIGQMQNLLSLNVGSNDITDISTEIGQLEKLEWININANPYTLPSHVVEQSLLNPRAAVTFLGNPVAYHIQYVGIYLLLALILFFIGWRFATLRKLVIGAGIGGVLGSFFYSFILNMIAAQMGAAALILIVCIPTFMPISQFGMLLGGFIGLCIGSILKGKESGKKGKQKR